MPPRPAALAVAGGVAANKRLKAALEQISVMRGYTLHTPPAALCTDNGAMIAWAGAERLALGLTDTLDFASPPALAARSFGAARNRRWRESLNRRAIHDRGLLERSSAKLDSVGVIGGERGARRWRRRCALPAATCCCGRASPRPSKTSTSGTSTAHSCPASSSTRAWSQPEAWQRSRPATRS